MSEKPDFSSDPSDWIHGIPQKVEELARVGDIYDNGMQRAIYKSSDPNVEYIEVRVDSEEVQSHIDSTLLISFRDASYYLISWSEGSIWTFNHVVNSEADGRDETRVLPYSNGKLRHSYVSGREIDPGTEAKSYLLFRNILAEGYHGEPFIPIEDIDGFITQVMKDVAASKTDPRMELLDVMSKDIDPKDIDFHEMFKQIHDIDPETDRLKTEEVLAKLLNPTEYEYMFSEERRIIKALRKLERQGKENEVHDVLVKEMEYLTRISPHINKRLHIRSSNIRSIGFNGEAESTDVNNISGTLRSLCVTEYLNKDTGEPELGMYLMLEIERPYPEGVFDNGQEYNPFTNPVAFIPLHSISEIREYPSFFED